MNYDLYVHVYAYKMDEIGVYFIVHQLNYENCYS
jgi:hypothetical protein